MPRKKKVEASGVEVVWKASGNIKPPDEDSWKHRSLGMRCRTCVSFVVKHSSRPIDPHNPVAALGRCRRHAPTLSGWPAVYEVDWCGDHKIDEEKI